MPRKGRNPTKSQNDNNVDHVLQNQNYMQLEMFNVQQQVTNHAECTRDSLAYCTIELPERVLEKTNCHHAPQIRCKPCSRTLSQH